VAPADPPHGTRHAKLVALVEAHVDDGLEVACDLLTRTSRISDIAPDVSVYPEAPHPETGRRQLEHVAFEVVSTVSISYAGRKAARLVERGVRRVFAIDVERSRALEWSSELGAWRALDPHGVIDDPVFAVPLPIPALLHSSRADDAMASALLGKHNPVLEAASEQATARGLADGKREGLVEARIGSLRVILEARGISLTPADRARIAGERDPARLERWIAKAMTCADVAELFAAG
jgi:hypothetical protein